MDKYVVGMGDMKISRDPQSEVITYALGSCIGLAVYDPKVNIGGIIHYMLPESKLNIEKSRNNPFMFADTGVPLFFKKLYNMGASNKSIVIKAAGGANLLDPKDRFNIGKRNYMVLRKLLWKNRLMIKNESVGGSAHRTLKIDMSTGQVFLKMPGQGFTEF
jgi:chemotaxis protein CheD